MKTIKRISAAALAVAVGFGIAAPSASADEVEDFYKGKRLKMIVGSGAGGGYDVYARLVARHIGKHIPGNPTMIVQNMTGAGGIIGANFVFNAAPKDGSIVGGLQRSVPLVQLMGQKGPKFKAAELNWLGSLAKEAGVCAVAKRTGVKNFSGLFGKQLTFGGTGPNSTEFWPALLRNTMGANMKLIRGYQATPQIHLAIGRGELDGVCQSWASFAEQAKHMLDSGEIVPLVQISLHPDPQMTKLGVPLLSDVLTKDQLAKGVTMEDARLYFQLTVIPPVFGRPFAMAAEVPRARVVAMKNAFAAMTKDPEFLADAKRIKREIEFVSGDEIEKILKELSKTPTEKMAALKEMFKFKGPVEKVELPIVVEAGKVVKIQRDGRRITIDYKGKNRRANVSGSKTEVLVDGKKAKRKAIKMGMNCTFHYYGNKTTAKKLDCKS